MTAAVIPRKALPPPRGPRSRESGTVDAAALGPGRIEMRLSAAMSILGFTNAHDAARLTAAGFLERGPSGAKQPYYLVDPSASPEQAFMTWFEREVAARPTGWRYPDFDRVHMVMKILRVKCIGHLPALERLALEDMLDMGALNPAEVTARLHPPAAELAATLRRLRNEAGKVAARHKPGKDGGITRAVPRMDLDTFRAILPHDLAHAPRTCLDDQEPDSWGRPSESAMGRVAALGPFRDRAAFATLLTAGRARRTQVVDGVVRVAERMDRLFDETGGDPGDADDVARVLDGYLAGELLPEDRPAVRFDTVLQYLSNCRYTRAATNLRSLPGLRRCREHAWISPGQRWTGKELCRSEDRRLRGEGNERRSLRAAGPKDELDRLLVALDLRRDQLAACGDAASCAAAELAEGAAGINFAVEGPGLRLDGSLVPVPQLLEFTAWRERDLLLDLIEQRVEGDNPWRAVARRKLEELANDGHAGEVYCEYLGARTESGDTGVEPFWAATLATGTWCRPDALPTSMKLERREIVREWRLPPPIQHRAGLFGFGRAGGALFRAAGARGRMVLPVVEFDHAMRFGHLGARQGIMTGARPHESMQIARSKGRVAVATIDGVHHEGWLAMCKVPATTPLAKMEERCIVLDGRTWAYAEDVAQLTSRRCHGGEPIPEVAPPASSSWKASPARLFHSYSGVALSPAELNHYLRHLSAGLMDVRLHDLRHANLNRLKHAGVPLLLRALSAGHSEWQAKRYSADTADQLARLTTAAMAATEARSSLGTGTRRKERK